MKQGTTSIQNITCDTAEKFRKAKLQYQGNMGESTSNDDFLNELLKLWSKA